MNHLSPNHETVFSEQEAAVAALQAQIQDLRRQLRRAEAKARRQEARAYFIEENYNLVVNSNGHKLLEKLYAIKNKLRPKKTEPPVVHHNPDAPLRDAQYLALKSCSQIDILASEATKATAEAMAQLFSQSGLTCHVHTEAPAQLGNHPYIIMGEALPTVLPKHYILMGKLPTDATELLHNACAVFVHSTEQMLNLRNDNSLRANLFYLPLSPYKEVTVAEAVSDGTLAYYLGRFLLAYDLLSFDRFYELAGHYIRFTGDRICLSLPETPERRISFEADNDYGFEVFNGLKHHLGWVGCGLSYKFIWKKAKEQGLPQVLICEDDVYFSEDFPQRFEAVLDYLNSHDDWNIFSGVMADVGEVSILNYADINGEEFIYLDKLISTVFNIYRSGIYDIGIAWDEANRDKAANAIDRYLERSKLDVITTCPFLVGHKEDLDSTIWNHKNDLYTAGIEHSSRKLALLMDDYLYRNQN